MQSQTFFNKTYLILEDHEKKKCGSDLCVFRWRRPSIGTESVSKPQGKYNQRYWPQSPGKWGNQSGNLSFVETKPYTFLFQWHPSKKKKILDGSLVERKDDVRFIFKNRVKK